MVARFIHAVRLLIVLASRHRGLVLESLAVQQQLALYRRTRPTPAIRWSDRPFWIGLRWAWPDWKSALVVVRPATVVAWHRRGFAWYWTRQSRPRGGRPQIGADVRRLVQEMAVANPLWGAPRIHGELLKLGFDVSERTVSRLIPRRRQPPSQGWRTFLKNHVGCTAAVDFFAVPTLTCRILFVFVILAHDQRRILHVNVTRHPTSAWTRQQLRESFPDEAPSRFLVHDGDATFDAAFGRTAEAFGLTSVRTAPRSPRQNPNVERVIGPSVASVWTTSSSSMSDISGGCCEPTSRTTSTLERTSRSARTRPRDTDGTSVLQREGSSVRGEGCHEAVTLAQRVCIAGVHHAGAQQHAGCVRDGHPDDRTARSPECQEHVGRMYEHHPAILHGEPGGRQGCGGLVGRNGEMVKSKRPSRLLS